MSEKTMRKKVVKILKPLDAQPIESHMMPGVPDIWFCYGGIECKWKKEFPKRASTPVRFPHYTQSQRIWHRRRRKKNGTVWVLVQIGRQWFLFDAAVAAGADLDNKTDRLGEWTKAQMEEKCVYHWKNGLDEKFVGILATMRV